MSVAIQSIEPVERPAPPGGARTVAKFTVEIDGLRLFGLLLRELPDGSRRTVAQNIAGRHSVTFRRDLAEQITAAASKALGGHIAKNSETRK